MKKVYKITFIVEKSRITNKEKHETILAESVTLAEVKLREKYGSFCKIIEIEEMR